MEKVFSKRSRFELSCSGALFSALILNAFLFFLYEAKYCQRTILPTNFYKQFYKLLEIYQILYEMLTRVFPILILILSNLLICLIVKKSHQKSKRNESIKISKAKKKSVQEAQLTNMSIFVTVLYVSTTVPMIFAFPGLLFKDTNTYVYKTYAALSNILELIQCSFRFAIYVCFTTQFRNSLRSLLVKKNGMNSGLNQIVNQNQYSKIIVVL